MEYDETGLQSVDGASAGTRTRVPTLATWGDNHYTTLAEVTRPLSRGINGYRPTRMLTEDRTYLRLLHALARFESRGSRLQPLQRQTRPKYRLKRPLLGTPHWR